MSRIQRISLSQQVIDRIKEQILNLDLPPGSRLVVDTLAEELGVSRTPVREGLKELTVRGLITYDGKSYVVTTYVRQDIEELFTLRRTLEIVAASSAALKINKENTETLRRLLKESDEFYRQKDTEELISSDIRFHEYIAAWSENRRLGQLLDVLQDQTWHVRRWLFLPELVEYVESRTIDEHSKILKCIENHDCEGAGNLMDEHLRRGEQRTLEKFEQRMADR